MQSRTYNRAKFQKYLSSRSTSYKNLLDQKKGSDTSFAYFIDGKLLKKNYEVDLASLADSTFRGLEIIDSISLVNTYAIAGKSAGVLITTIKSSSKKVGVKKQKFDPQLLILSPDKVSFSPQAAKEIDEINIKLKGSPGEASAEKEKLAENIKLMEESAASFRSQLDFFKQMPLIAQGYLAYRFYERFPQTLILVKDAKAEGMAALARLAESEQMPYILGFPSVNLVKEKNRYVVYLRVQLYEQESNSLLIDKEYKGDDRNPGFEFSCTDGSLNCTLNNALAAALPDVIRAIAANNATLKAERALLAQRMEYVKNVIYPKTFDTSLLKQAIPASDQSIDFNNLYHCLYSPQQDKFVAFFCGAAAKKSLKSMSDSKTEGHVNIISNKDIKDKDFLNEMPGTYAYLVRGLLFNDRWYYKKDKVTYFDPKDNVQGKLEYLSNLHKWDYFKKDLAEPDTAFWRAQLFERVPDLRKDPEWEEYKEMWARSERENRDYIGLYELVASALKAEKETKEKAWQDSIQQQVFAPFFKEQMQSGKNGFKDTSPLTKESVLIYNKAKSYLLNAAEIKDAKGLTFVRYFLLLPDSGSIYEWTYFPSYQKKKGETANGIMPNLNTITAWNYSFDTLDDENFWSNYVLLQENGKYKYLTKLR